jgi:hypothetical protein
VGTRFPYLPPYYSIIIGDELVEVAFSMRENSPLGVNPD